MLNVPIRSFCSTGAGGGGRKDAWQYGRHPSTRRPARRGTRSCRASAPDLPHGNEFPCLRRVPGRETGVDALDAHANWRQRLRPAAYDVQFCPVTYKLSFDGKPWKHISMDSQSTCSPALAGRPEKYLSIDREYRYDPYIISKSPMYQPQIPTLRPALAICCARSASYQRWIAIPTALGACFSSPMPLYNSGLHQVSQVSLQPRLVPVLVVHQ